MGWDALAAIAAILAVAWSYGSAGEERRAEFRAWISGNIEKAKPTAMIALAKLVLLAVSIGAGIVAWSSAREIYEFKVSLEPITRSEILRLFVVVFNTFVYSIASITLAIAILKPFENSQGIHSRRTGEVLKLRFDQSPLSGGGLEALSQHGVTLRVVSVKRGKVQVRLENSTGVSVSESLHS